jgi:hypothetical protein
MDTSAAIRETEEPLRVDQLTRRFWDSELRAAFKPYQWLFPRLRGEALHDVKPSEYRQRRFAGQPPETQADPPEAYQITVYLRFRDAPLATITRVAAGWRLVIGETGDGMVFTASAATVAWLVREQAGDPRSTVATI